MVPRPHSRLGFRVRCRFNLRLHRLLRLRATCRPSQAKDQRKGQRQSCQPHDDPAQHFPQRLVLGFSLLRPAEEHRPKQISTEVGAYELRHDCHHARPKRARRNGGSHNTSHRQSDEGILADQQIVRDDFIPPHTGLARPPNPDVDHESQHQNQADQRTPPGETFAKPSLKRPGSSRNCRPDDAPEKRAKTRPIPGRPCLAGMASFGDELSLPEEEALTIVERVAGHRQAKNPEENPQGAENCKQSFHSSLLLS